MEEMLLITTTQSDSNEMTATVSMLQWRAVIHSFLIGHEEWNSSRFLFSLQRKGTNYANEIWAE